MKKQIDIASVRCLITIVRGDPADAMEAAKRLVRFPQFAPSGLLAEIAVDDRFGQWSRIASIYALGLVGTGQLTPTMRRLADDAKETSAIRSHALESLGNLKDSKAVPILRRLLMDKSSDFGLKKSAVYALTQIANRAARLCLAEFGSMNPRSKICRGIPDEFLSFAKKPLRRTGG